MTFKMLQSFYMSQTMYPVYGYNEQRNNTAQLFHIKMSVAIYSHEIPLFHRLNVMVLLSNDNFLSDMILILSRSN